MTESIHRRFPAHVSIAATVVLSIGFCLHAPHAWACKCVPLDYGFIGPYTSRLPANASGIPWYVSTERARRSSNEDQFAVDEARFSLEILDEEQFRQIPLRVAVAEEFSRQFDDTFHVRHRAK